MPVYSVVQVIVQDGAAFQAYLAEAGAALAKHGGRVVAGGPASEVLEDTGGGGEAVLAMVEFPDRASAHAWIGDPELDPVHALRRKGAKTKVTLLGDLSL